MLNAPRDRYGEAAFLASWFAEIRAGYTPAHDLDLDERLSEYLDAEVPPEREAALTATVKAETERYLAAERLAEDAWSGPTTNDILTRAFAALDGAGILAIEDAGLSIKDGWARVGQAVKPHHHGAAFFHRYDVMDVLDGMSLLVAFGTSGPDPGDDRTSIAIGEQVAEHLASHGFSVTWSGRSEDRIEVAPFTWQRRRWTMPGTILPPSKQPWTKRSPQLPLIVPVFDERKYGLSDYARRTCHAFDVVLAHYIRAFWKLLGGERGQPVHVGLPHTFVPAGEVVTMIPRDAMTNLDAEEAAALRRRSLEIRAATKGP